MGDLRATDLREALEALRDRLADELEHGVACVRCGGQIASTTAPVAKQLRDTLNQLDGLRVPEGSKTDELKKRRARRQASVAAGSAGGV